MSSMVVSVYSEKALKEFVLPAAVNTETGLSIQEDVFGLEGSYALRLENLDGQWRFLPVPGLSVFRGEEPYGGEPLADRDYFRCVSGGRMILAVMVSQPRHRFEGFVKYALSGGSVSIGSAPGCGLRYSFESSGSQYITREHAVVSVSQGGLALTDKSRNGVFVNDARISGTVPLHFGDKINIWGLHLVVLGSVLAVRPCEGLSVDGSQLRPGDAPGPMLPDAAGKLRYHRSPRTVGRLFSGTVEIEAPPSPQASAEPPLFLTIGPALTMALPMLAGSAMAVVGSGYGGAFMYTGILTAMLSAVIGAMWAVINLRYARKMSKKAEEHRFSAYSDYLLRITEDIRGKYENNRQVMLQAYPQAGDCMGMGLRLEHLWERNPNHADFLTYRVGLGDVPFQVDIRAPQEKFDLVDDSLRDKPRLIRENYQTLHDVPVCIDLKKERVVGLVGGPGREGARQLLEGIVAQAAVQNSYTEVKLAFVYREGQGDDQKRWAWCRWLPHVWSEGRRARFVAADRTEASDVFYDLASVLRARSERPAGAGRGEGAFRPWYILVLEDSAMLENEPVAKFLLGNEGDLGVTTLILADSQDQLPNECECVVRTDGGRAVMYHTQAGGEAAVEFTPERVAREKLEQMARALANVEVGETETGGEIPRAVSFFEMYGITRLEDLRVSERWKKNRNYENMRALIGIRSGGQPCYLDVHEKYHGPHGLVAGTTGSGKSETLQTYILSLAVNFSPDDVGLFIIDYKGGGMANLFEGLPHTLGQISNLSGGQVHRAMASIKSENMRRQRIFNENGVNNINLYTTLYKNGEAAVPVPHLFIIIDEFAELKREQPDFMRELISVAQVGRSLGVHLILATQKPSGTVDDNIWSNAKFRLCLRVQDRQDSMDMLHKPDAAYLTQAGRGFLQVGNDEIFEQFQSGWSGAEYDEDAGSSGTAARMLTNSGRTALAGSYVKRRLKEKRRLRWVSALCGAIGKAGLSMEKAGAGEESLGAVYGRLEEAGLDYARTEYNSRCLSGLLELYARALAQGISEEGIPAWVLGKAAEEGIKLPEQKEQTQLDAVVDYLSKMARQEGCRTQSPLWQPPLPEKLFLKDLPGWAGAFPTDGGWPAHEIRWELSAPVGLADDPSAQMQMPVELNFSTGGHHALLGSAATGKSTFAQTLVYSLLAQYSPDYLNIYALDFSSRMLAVFEGAPGVGGVLHENDPEQAGKLFYLLQEMVRERKELFRGGSFSQYVMVHGPVCPAVLLVVDGMANFREKTGEQYDDALIRLAREGAAYGIYLFLTGGAFGAADIPGRLADHISTTLTLSLSDIYQYGEALRGPQPGVFPEAGVRGRGLAEMDGTVLEYQTALAKEAEDDYSRAEEIRAGCREMAAWWGGQPARPVPFIPEKPVWDDLEGREEFPRLLEDPRMLPVGFVEETAGIYSLDLSRSYCCILSGKARTGKTNALKVFLRSARAKGGKLAVLEPKGASLQKEALVQGARYCSSLEETVLFVGELAEVFRWRNRVKREMLAAGEETEAVFRRMSAEEPWFIFVSDLVDFVEMAYSRQGRERVLNGALENLVGKGFLHNIYFIAGFNQDDRARVLGLELYEAFVKDPCGVHLGGNPAAQQVFDFSSIPFSEQSRAGRAGTGLVPAWDGEPCRRVVLPLARERGPEEGEKEGWSNDIG